MVMAMIKVQEEDGFIYCLSYFINMRRKKKIKVSFNLVTTPSDGCDEDNVIVISAKVHGSKESSSLKPGRTLLVRLAYGYKSINASVIFVL